MPLPISSSIPKAVRLPRPLQPAAVAPTATRGADTKAVDVFGAAPTAEAPAAKVLNGMLGQLDVEHNPKWQPRGKRGTKGRSTYCNQFAQAALKKLGVPTPPGNANSMNSYFNHAGKSQGWRAVTAADAQKMANGGHAVVASWKNPTGGHGHIAIVRPGQLGPGGPRIAQAGGHNFNNATVRQGFGKDVPQFFVHD